MKNSSVAVVLPHLIQEKWQCNTRSYHFPAFCCPTFLFNSRLCFRFPLGGLRVDMKYRDGSEVVVAWFKCLGGRPCTTGAFPSDFPFRLPANGRLVVSSNISLSVIPHPLFAMSVWKSQEFCVQSKVGIADLIYRKSENFRYMKFSLEKFSCWNVFVGRRSYEIF